jgi:type I restriction enzyme M protein
MAKTNNNTAGIGFEQQIWAAEYKHVVLGLIFLKYISDKFEERYRELEADLGGYNADTFYNNLHPTLKADLILANPPFNLSDWNNGSLNDDPRWKYGLPPSGKIGMVLANCSLSSQSSNEGDIRRKIVEDDLVDGIIAMPTQLFYTTQIPVSLWFVNRNKKQKGKTLFIDARKMGTMENRRLRKMTDEDIAKIAATFEAFNDGTLEDVKGFCNVATINEIAKQDYILTPGRYVGIEEQEDDGEPFDEKMMRLTSELSEMFKKSHELEGEIRKRLGAIGYEI